MLALIVGISVYFTCKLKGIQRHLGAAVSLSLKKSHAAGAVSSFGALVIALAAMVGTGNIVGVAAAQTPNSVRQGLISATTVFWDTLVICLLSGVAVVIAGDW